MVKPRLQIIHDASIKSIRVWWLAEREVARGRNYTYWHPDVEIFVVGRDSSLVSYNIQLALQDAHMPVRALVRPKAR